MIVSFLITNVHEITLKSIGIHDLQMSQKNFKRNLHIESIKQTLFVTQVIMKIGKKIRILRELNGYSQDYMSIQLDVSQTTYSRIESENIKVDIERLGRIAEILDIDLVSLLVFNENKIYEITAKKSTLDEIDFLEKCKLIETRILYIESALDKLKKKN